MYASSARTEVKRAYTIFFPAADTNKCACSLFISNVVPPPKRWLLNFGTIYFPAISRVFSHRGGWDPSGDGATAPGRDFGAGDRRGLRGDFREDPP